MLFISQTRGFRLERSKHELRVEKREVFFTTRSLKRKRGNVVVK